jgi:hypothetical protein
MAFVNKNLQIKPQKLELQIQQLYWESGRQINLQVSSQSPVVW